MNRSAGLFRANLRERKNMGAADAQSNNLSKILILSLFGAKSNQKARAAFFASIPKIFW
jgi:hypothetical protein